MDERSSYLTHLEFEQAGDLPFAEKFNCLLQQVRKGKDFIWLKNSKYDTAREITSDKKKGSTSARDGSDSAASTSARIPPPV
jgi:hypothetical protein